MKREKTCSYIALDSARSLFLRCLCWRTCGASQYLWIYQLLRVQVLNLHRILYYKLLKNKLHFQLDSGFLTSTNACALENKQINYTFMYWSFTAQQYDATVCVRNDVLICIVISGLYGWHQTLFYLFPYRDDYKSEAFLTFIVHGQSVYLILSPRYQMEVWIPIICHCGKQ